MNRKTKKIVKEDFSKSYKTNITINDIFDKTDFFESRKFIKNNNNIWKNFSICSSLLCIFLLVFIFVKFPNANSDKIPENNFGELVTDEKVENIKICEIELDQDTIIDIFSAQSGGKTTYYYMVNGKTTGLVMLANDVAIEVNKQGKLATVEENDVIKLNIKNREGEVQYYIGK